MKNSSIKYTQFTRSQGLCAAPFIVAEAAAGERSLEMFELVRWSPFSRCGLPCGALIKKSIDIVASCLLGFFTFRCNTSACTIKPSPLVAASDGASHPEACFQRRARSKLRHAFPRHVYEAGLHQLYRQIVTRVLRKAAVKLCRRAR